MMCVLWRCFWLVHVRMSGKSALLENFFLFVFAFTHVQDPVCRRNLVFRNSSRAGPQSLSNASRVLKEENGVATAYARPRLHSF
jgi:hypothetical protein